MIKFLSDYYHHRNRFMASGALKINKKHEEYPSFPIFIIVLSGKIIRKRVQIPKRSVHESTFVPNKIL